jgi:hypothetical protein
MGTLSTVVSLEHNLWLRSFSISETDLSQTFIVTVSQPQRRLRYAYLELLFLSTSTCGIFLCFWGVAVHASFRLFLVCSPVFMASKLFGYFCGSVYHFKKMDFAHLKRSFDSKNGTTCLRPGVLCWNKFQFLLRNIWVKDLPRKIINRSFSLQGIKTIQLYEKKKLKIVCTIFIILIKWLG